MIIYENTIPGQTIWFFIGISVLVLAFSYWRYLKISIPVLVMASFRLLFLGALIWCMYQPQKKETETTEVKPRFVVVIDNSESMVVKVSDDAPTRWSIAKKALEQSWKDIIRVECEIDTYVFATEVSSSMKFDELAELKAEGKSTLIRDSLRKLMQRYRGQNITGFLVLSDGIDTREAYDDWASEAWDFPVYTLRLEPENIFAESLKEPDVHVDTVQTPRRVNVDWNTELRAVISGTGTGGSPINVQLYKNRTLIQEAPIQLPVEGGSKEVLFPLENPKIGVYKYEVIVPAMPRESMTNDNSFAVSVRVIDSKNRLFYVEGSPRWESKYLTRALRANDNITPLCFLRGANDKFIKVGVSGSMTADMREDQLAFFKILILGNLTAEELTEQRAQNLVQFVETGGSLVLLGGSKGWGPEGFWQTRLAKISPIKKHNPKIIEGSFPVVLTDTARAHAAFQGNDQLWANLPHILSIFPQASLSPAAEALVVAKTNVGMQPIIVSQRYGQGKVVAILTDSLWKWQLNPSDNETKPYQRFWEQLLSWLIPKDSDVSDVQTVELFSNREQTFLGEKVELSARFGNKNIITKGAITCEITTPDNRKIPYEMKKQHVITPDGNSFEGYLVEYESEKAGLYTAIAISGTGSKKVQSEPISFFVKPFTPESVPKPANSKVMKAIAANSGGKFCENVSQLNTALSDLNFTTTEEESSEYKTMWANWLWLIILMLMLTTEWIIRKLKNLP